MATGVTQAMHLTSMHEQLPPLLFITVRAGMAYPQVSVSKKRGSCLLNKVVVLRIGFNPTRSTSPCCNTTHACNIQTYWKYIHTYTKMNLQHTILQRTDLIISPLPSRQSPLLQWCLFEGKGDTASAKHWSCYCLHLRVVAIATTTLRWWKESNQQQPAALQLLTTAIYPLIGNSLPSTPCPRPLFSPLTVSNANRFSKFFHRQT